MTGKSHIVSSTALAFTMYSGMDFMIHDYQGALHEQLVPMVVKLQQHIFVPPEHVPVVVWYLCCYCVYILGALLADIDAEYSILGKYVHLPIEHRTWTHTIYGIIVFGILSIFYPILFFLTLGAFIHLVLDSPSVCGVCWFYPISKYRHFGGSGAKVKEKHILKLYRTGEPSEYVFVGLLLLCTLFVLYLDIKYHVVF